MSWHQNELFPVQKILLLPTIITNVLLDISDFLTLYSFVCTMLCRQFLTECLRLSLLLCRFYNIACLENQRNGSLTTFSMKHCNICSNIVWRYLTVVIRNFHIPLINNWLTLLNSWTWEYDWDKNICWCFLCYTVQYWNYCLMGINAILMLSLKIVMWL